MLNNTERQIYNDKIGEIILAYDEEVIMKKLNKLISACCVPALVLPIAAVPPASAQETPAVVINEICAKNTSFAAGDGNFYDWIELYNPSEQTVSLSGYGLSDKEGKPYKYTFPDNTSIGAGERLIVFCDSLIPEIPGQYTAAFGLSTSGETLTLTAPDGTTSDTVTFGIMETNVTYGRVPDGSEDFAVMRMTPGAPNEKNDVISVDVPEPVFSQTGGFYDSSFDLTITVPQGTTVYYTLDGSTPTTDSDAYTSPISVSDPTSSPNKLSAITNIAASSWGGSGATAPSEPVDKAFIVNAVAVDQEGNVSDTVTAAYFIGYGGRASYYNDMRVISIVTDSENLFDYEKGIYVLGKVHDDWRNGPEYNPAENEWAMPANYTQKGAAWEREASMQIYEKGQLSHSQNVGLRIHGGATRSAPQKSFNVYARSEYGASKFEFDLFSGTLRSEATGKKIKEFDSFMLRNGGNDGQYTRFRDKLNQLLVSDRNILTQAMEPAVVFINGEYWGHYEITEKLDEDFVDAHYQVGKKNVCIVKNSQLDAGDAETFAEWKQLDKWIESTDFSNNSNYEQLCEKVDMQSFADYISAEIYYNNSDWGNNNTAMWKSTRIDPENPWSDGKWRFILFDTEYSVNLYDQTPPTTNSFSQLTQKDCFITNLLVGAMKNESFRQQFCTTFMDMANENFSAERIYRLISEISAEYHDVSIDTHDRFWPSANTGNNPWGGWGGWGGQQTAEQNYNDQVNQVKSFYQSRFQSITGSLRNFGSLSGNLASVTVKNDPAMGDVTLNTISPNFTNGSWSGKYYTDYPVQLTAEPKSGYRFSHWDISDGTEERSASASISFTRDITITAVYEKSVSLIGDVNVDGKVDVADLVLLHNYLMGKTPLTAEQSANAELCIDGTVNTFDLVKLRKLLIE